MSQVPMVRTLFEQVAALPPHEREAYLAQLDVDPAIVQRVRRMVLADETLGELDDDKEVVHRAHPWPGDHVGGYRLIAPIGTGGMGTVWRASRLSCPDAQVAIKFPDWSRLDREEAIGRLRQERVVLAAMSHRGVVSLLDAGETESGTPYLVLEELVGQPLDRYLHTSRRSAADVMRTTQMLCEAVAAVHDLGVVHRDIKPSNVLVSPDGWPVLIDFGIAAMTSDSKLTPSYVTQGATPMTPAFASPEQELGITVSPAMDVFAIGRLIDDMLKGVIDPEAEAARTLASVARRACEPHIQQRYQTARELMRDLVEHAQTKDKRSGTHILAWVAVVALAVTLGVVGSLVLTRQLGGEETVRVPVELFEHLGELELSDFPGEPDTLLELSRKLDSAGLAVAAMARLVEEGEFGHARFLLDDEELLAREGGEDHLLSVASLRTGFGQPRAALRTLDQVEVVDLVESGAELNYRLLRAINRYRAGYMQDLHTELVRLHARAEAVDEEIMAELIRHHQLASGDPDSIEEWLEHAEPEALADPFEVSVEEQVALLSLHRILVVNGLSAVMDQALMHQIEAELGEDAADEPSLLVMRGRALLQTIRLLQSTRVDPEEARLLVERGLSGLDHEATPDDAGLMLLSMATWCQEQLGEAGGGETWAEVEAIATEVLGPDSPLTAAVATHGTSSELDPISQHLMKNTTSVVETLERYVLGELEDQPWWFRPLDQ